MKRNTWCTVQSASKTDPVLVILPDGTGSNERLVGAAVAPFRDEIVIATKFGFDLTGTRPSRVDSRPEHILEVADNSLRYLGTDHIDRARRRRQGHRGCAPAA